MRINARRDMPRNIFKMLGKIHVLIADGRQLPLWVVGRNSRVFPIGKNCEFNFFRVNSPAAAFADARPRRTNFLKVDSRESQGDWLPTFAFS